MNRRRFLQTGSLAITATSVCPPFALAADESGGKRAIKKAVKFGMFKSDLPLAERFKALREAGFDGVELDSPGGVNKEEALKASRETGFPIHGVVDSVHWNIRLSSPDEETREKGRAALETAVRESHLVGGTSVLLVPGRVADEKNENQDQVWERSIEQIKKVLPVAEELKIHILIENVWNGFCYQHDGPDDQSADKLAEYLDALGSEWTGSYFDIGNHQKYGKPEQWIRTLGKRIKKLDCKDWGKENNFCKIGDGDVNWPAVRESLAAIGYSGWATAEVSGGPLERMKEIAARMDKYLLGKGA